MLIFLWFFNWVQSKWPSSAIFNGGIRIEVLEYLFEKVFGILFEYRTMYVGKDFVSLLTCNSQNERKIFHEIRLGTTEGSDCCGTLISSFEIVFNETITVDNEKFKSTFLEIKRSVPKLADIIWDVDVVTEFYQKKISLARLTFKKDNGSCINLDQLLYLTLIFVLFQVLSVEKVSEIFSKFCKDCMWCSHKLFECGYDRKDINDLFDLAKKNFVSIPTVASGSEIENIDIHDIMHDTKELDEIVLEIGSKMSEQIENVENLTRDKAKVSFFWYLYIFNILNSIPRFYGCIVTATKKYDYVEDAIIYVDATKKVANMVIELCRSISTAEWEHVSYLQGREAYQTYQQVLKILSEHIDEDCWEKERQQIPEKIANKNEISIST